MIDAARDGGRRADHLDADLDARRGQLAHPLLESGQDRLPVLVRHQTHAHLGRRLRRDDRFRALACEPADETVCVERGAAAGALDREKILLAFERLRDGHPPHVLDIPRVILLPGRQLLGAGWAHRVVETRDGDVAVPVFQLADDARQRVDRVGRHAAKRP